MRRMPCDSLSDNRRASWAVKIVSEPLELGREAPFVRLSLKARRRVGFPGVEIVFSAR